MIKIPRRPNIDLPYVRLDKEGIKELYEIIKEDGANIKIQTEIKAEINDYLISEKGIDKFFEEFDEFSDKCPDEITNLRIDMQASGNYVAISFSELGNYLHIDSRNDTYFLGKQQGILQFLKKKKVWYSFFRHSFANNLYIVFLGAMIGFFFIFSGFFFVVKKFLFATFLLMVGFLYIYVLNRYVERKDMSAFVGIIKKKIHWYQKLKVWNFIVQAIIAVAAIVTTILMWIKE